MGKLAALISIVYHRRPELPDTRQPESPTSANPRYGIPVVRLLPGHQPRGEVERHLCAVLAKGPLPLDAVLDEVADRLLHVEVSRGGWAVDIGVLGSDMYRPRAARKVRALDGLMLRIELPASDTSSGCS